MDSPWFGLYLVAVAPAVGGTLTALLGRASGDEARQRLGCRVACLACGLCAVFLALADLPVAVVPHLIGAAGWAYWWWRDRRRRDRAPRRYGAKSRALVARLVAGLRDAVRPRPGRRLAPQGAAG